ncbi:TPA: zonular occludens toxin domain-containing protein [Acinetobacter baumannii]|nr:zonular occludens toxin domain-containing protein [Acinetobacter baumannii]
MAITLLSAVPGSGKTLKAVEMIYEYLNKGYVVYSNILGLKVVGVHRLEQNADWRDLDHFRRTNPEMAKTPIAVFYDEAHEHAAFADRNLIEDKQKLKEIREIGYALSLHRHFGFEIILITQSPRKLAAHVLADVGNHLYLRRVFKLERATIFEFPEAITQLTKSTRKDALLKTNWKFPKQLYGSYISTEINTHTSGFPMKYKVYICLGILALIFLGYRLYTDRLLGKKEEVVVSDQKPVKQNTESFQNQTETKPIKSQQSFDLEKEEQQRIAMIIESATDCVAKNSNGDFIDISIEECKRLSVKNVRMHFSKIKKPHLLDDQQNLDTNKSSEQSFL